MQNAPPHGQQGVIHGEGVAHTVAGLDAERGDGQADEGAGHGGELHVAAHAPPGGEDVERDPRPGEAGVQLVHALGTCMGTRGRKNKSMQKANRDEYWGYFFASLCTTSWSPTLQT